MTQGTVTLYTDGACSGNPGPGGWAAILIYKGQEKELSGGETMTTNNRMELKAVIEGLRALTRPCPVMIYVDSQYVRRGMTEWLVKWKLNNWRTADKKPVKNDDLWRELDSEVSRHTVYWRWVKGHASSEYNQRADALAVAEWKKIRGESPPE
ncbi:MAG: ribonuclease HI [Methylobacteriaceae bacterium]|jgi:ribonuclease HI|nr:ribonuclease HI [Methylobacteriaceae bacterium]